MLKKIEIQLLLADLALELAYAPSRLGQLGQNRLFAGSWQRTRCRARLRGRLGLDRGPRLPPSAQRQCSSAKVARSPHVERLARRPDLLGQQWHILTSQHALHRRQLHLTIVSTSFAFWHQLSPELSPYPCLTFGVHSSHICHNVTDFRKLSGNSS